MFKEINFKNDDNFEERILQIYNQYEHRDISDEYKDLWNGFVELIQYIQNQDTVNNMSPMEMIKLLKEIGFSDQEIKNLFLAQIKAQ